MSVITKDVESISLEVSINGKWFPVFGLHVNKKGEVNLSYIISDTVKWRAIKRMKKEKNLLGA